MKTRGEMRRVLVTGDRFGDALAENVPSVATGLMRGAIFAKCPDTVGETARDEGAAT
jgi:hypothetical protein